MVDILELKKVIHYCPKTGVFTWIDDRRGAVKAGSRAGSLTKESRWVLTVLGCRYRANRLAWFYMLGRWPAEGMSVDHINRKPWDDRWQNLREVSSLQNARNSCLSRANKSGRVGVRRAGGGRWKADIGVCGSIILLGNFATFAEAEEAREGAERRYGFSAGHGSERVDKEEKQVGGERWIGGFSRPIKIIGNGGLGYVKGLRRASGGRLWVKGVGIVLG